MGRCIQLNDVKPKGDGKAVIYVMARDQRVQGNHALAAAQSYARERDLPLSVIFCLRKINGYVAREQYQFMVDGFDEIEAELGKLSIPFMMMFGAPSDMLASLDHHIRLAAVFFDFSPLRGPRAMQTHIADQQNYPVFTVDTHNAVPVWGSYPKQAIGARVLRKPIHQLLPDELAAIPEITKHPISWLGTVISVKKLQSKIDEVVQSMPPNGTKVGFASGPSHASKMLDDFIENRLKGYAEKRNDPSLDHLSGLSPYLHFGHISSLQVVERVQAANGDHSQEDVDTLIEELIIRKDLSDNFCYYNEKYDQLAGAPNWAQESLNKHLNDPREHVYTCQQLEDGETDDQAWNAAQKQMRQTGKIHGYMRMYWAKKVLEWTKSPQDALEILLYLNDFYHLDGRDPNGYVGILWSIAGVHDRPWGNRPVIGGVRPMVYNGLKRKFDIESYIEQWT